jgi:tetratricopeptide (TPR) repeat protein
MMDVLVAQGDRAGAAQRAYELLQVDPASPDALAFLEDELRARSAWGELRALLLAAARVPGLGVDSRKQRLREVAALSADKLGDLDGAAGAWRAVTSLDPADADARATLAHLLEQLERWDELVQVLERDAISTLDPRTKAEIFRRLARLHRDQRGDFPAAAEAYQKLRELHPSDESARDELCDVLVELGAFREAVPLLRQRIDSAPRGERIRLLRTLAAVLDEHLGDVEGAFDVAARLLDDEPGDLDALARMERIDAAAERWDRLLQTLSYRAEIGQPDERAQILARMGALADQRLSDLDRAAEYYAQALDFAPSDTAALDALCDVYDRAERYRDLVELLRTRASMEERAEVRSELYRRIARILELPEVVRPTALVMSSCFSGGFAEIVFLAITETQKHRGFGTRVMNHLKEHVKTEDIKFFLKPMALSTSGSRALLPLTASWLVLSRMVSRCRRRHRRGDGLDGCAGQQRGPE